MKTPTTRKKSPGTLYLLKPFLPVVLILAVVQVFLANSLSVQGREIKRLENFKSDIESEIGSLRQEASYLSSLPKVRTSAKARLGMIEGFESFDYVMSVVALKR